ncbi:hypothetical protein TRFO_42167 [Tritrichomonas foetus]|uniref:Uncharacterized protein n=1 Tax=Tritrichomonas foetus TaxID=1144522 RepID=A0A1J4L201_9EUKA|nr:hypothetical protein TRFO_42167 [Tritrichomonas foetus]|eukprot:OHT15974.1 hypothetical protein TRFO_42167 [Tritrichomonas foetus]
MSVTKFAKNIIEYVGDKINTILVMIDEKVYKTTFGYSVKPLYVKCFGDSIYKIINFSELFEIFHQVPYINITTNRNRIIYKEPMKICIKVAKEEEFEGRLYFPYNIHPIRNQKDKKIYEQILPAVYEKIKEFKENDGEQIIDVESFI